MPLPGPAPAETRAELVAALEAPKFDLATEYLAALRVIVYALVFSSVCPWAIMVGGFGLLLTYLRVSILLAVRYERPQRIGDAIGQMTESLLPGIVWLHCAANVLLLVRWWWGGTNEEWHFLVFIWVWAGVFISNVYAMFGPTTAFVVRVAAQILTKGSDVSAQYYPSLIAPIQVRNL